jgi:hypothetical protein
VPVFVVLLGCSGNAPPPPSFALAEPKLDFQALAFRSSSGLLVLFRCAIFVPAVDETEILAPVPMVWRFSLFSVADVCRRFVAYALSRECSPEACFSLQLVCGRFVAYALVSLACAGSGCLVCSLLSKRLLVIFYDRKIYFRRSTLFCSQLVYHVIRKPVRSLFRLFDINPPNHQDSRDVRF